MDGIFSELTAVGRHELDIDPDREEREYREALKKQAKDIARTIVESGANTVAVLETNSVLIVISKKDPNVEIGRYFLHSLEQMWSFQGALEEHVERQIDNSTWNGINRLFILKTPVGVK
jgi:hypothetical protein